MNRQLQKIYPWLICLVSMLMILFTVGMVTIAFSTYLPFLRDELHMSNTQTSMIGTIRALVTTAAMLATTRFYRRFSIRIGMVFAGGMLAVSCILFYLACRTQVILLCYAAAVCMGFSYAFGSLIAASLLMHNWFEDHQATAISLASMGSSVATAVLPPILTKSIQSAGLGRTFLYEILAVLACCLIVFLVVRDTPQQMGMHPFKGKTAGRKKTPPASLKTGTSRGSAFLLYMSMLLIGLIGTPYSTHLTVHFSTIGFEPGLIALALSLVGTVGIAAKLLFGFLSDRYGTYLVNYVYMGSYVFCGLMMARLSLGQNSLLRTLSALSGIGTMMGSLGSVVWCGNLSTEEEYAERIKLCQTIFSLGTLVGAPIPGITADITGDYSLIYEIFGWGIAATTVIIQYLYIRYTRPHGRAAASGKHAEV